MLCSQVCDVYNCHTIDKMQRAFCWLLIMTHYLQRKSFLKARVAVDFEVILMVTVLLRKIFIKNSSYRSTACEPSGPSGQSFAGFCSMKRLADFTSTWMGC